MKKLLEILLPDGSRRRFVVARFLEAVGLKEPYRDREYKFWIRDVEPSLWETSIAKAGPKISIVIPFYNTKQRYFDELLESIEAQTYSNWEVIAVDASTEPEIQAMIQKRLEPDSRYNYVRFENKGIADNTNAGIQQTTGDYITFVDHDDTLAPQALNEIIHVIKNEQPDIIYSDEDLMLDDGTRRSAFFKPAFSPTLLRVHNYITHLFVIKAELLQSVGMLNAETDGAQDYDLVLRATEQAQSISHIPKVLYHWREAEGSSAQTITNKNYALTAGARAVTAHYERSDQLTSSMTIKPIGGRPGHNTIHFSGIKQQTRAAVVMNCNVMTAKADIVKRLKLRAYDTVDIFFRDFVEQNEAQSFHDVFNDYDHVVVINRPVYCLETYWLEYFKTELGFAPVAAAGGVIINNRNKILNYAKIKEYNNEFRDPMLDNLENQVTRLGYASVSRNFTSLSGGVFCLAADKLRRIPLTVNDVFNRQDSFFEILIAERLFVAVLQQARFQLDSSAHVLFEDRHFNPNFEHTSDNIELIRK